MGDRDRAMSIWKFELIDTIYVQFNLDGGTCMSIYHIDEQNNLAPGSAELRHNRSTILEFQVDDVDEEFRRLTKAGVDWVKHPTTQEWGNRSVYFRDPDGNLVNFYSRVNI
jgi:catechol 2,3-dioxygenase-like lactoylglutathione lyase family enzyme